jgi:hypothetical protein
VNNRTENSIISEIRRADVILIVILAAAAVFLMLMNIKSRTAFRGAELLITVGEKEFGRWRLTKDVTIDIEGHNVCEIRNGTVRMTEADCADQSCVHMAPIDEKGGSIVCLPNRVVLKITGTGSENPEVDTVAS